VREQILECTACELHTVGRGPVPFSGPTPAVLAVVGEAPGRQEDELGEPFIGPAGQLLRKALVDAGIPPATVFFCNPVSCFPDATPTKEHLHACATNLEAQLELAEPTWVLAVGNVALSTIRPDLRISRAHGHLFWPAGYGTFPAWFPTFHPSAALRTARTETVMRSDIAKLAAMVGADRSGWTRFVSDDCLGCGTSPEEMADHDMWLTFDDTGGSYCNECFQRSPQAKAEARDQRKTERFQARTGRLL
jgi:uracil-DNA glycosylase